MLAISFPFMFKTVQAANVHLCVVQWMLQHLTAAAFALAGLASTWQTLHVSTFQKMSHRGSFYNINQFCAPLAQRSVQRFSLWLHFLLKKMTFPSQSTAECVHAGCYFARATKIYNISNRWVQFCMNLGTNVRYNIRAKEDLNSISMQSAVGHVPRYN